MGVGIGRIATGCLFEVLGGGFKLALLQEHTAEFEISARRGTIGSGGLGKDGGGFRQSTLAEEKGSEIDAGVVHP